MAFSATTVTGSFTNHDGNSRIAFTKENKQLRVTIDTKNLHLESIQSIQPHYDIATELYSNQKVMEKHGDMKSAETVKKQVETVWTKNWNQDVPFSAFVISKRDEFLPFGLICLGLGQDPGETLLTFFLKPTHWHQGYGTEAVSSIVKHYLPIIKEMGYTLKGKQLSILYASAIPSNKFVVKILQKVGMTQNGSDLKDGSVKLFYTKVI